MRKRRTAESYEVPGVRVGLAVCLLAGAAAYAVQLRDPVGGILFSALLLLPRDFPPFVAVRRVNPTFGAGFLGLMLLLPIPDYVFVSENWSMAFAHLAMVLAVWKFQHPRLVGGDCRFLLGLSFFLAVLSTAGVRDGFFAPLLALHAVIAITMMTVLNLRLEEERILNLARVRIFERPEAMEVAGRKGTGRRAVVASLRQLSFWLIAGAFLIWWATPHVISGVGGVVDFILHGDRVATEDPLPEFPDEGPPPFALPPEVKAPPAFGPRLERDEFVRRLETDLVAALVRPKPGTSTYTRDLRIRGECYDVLAEDGRWIRARAAARTVFDGEDGTPDGAVEVLPVMPGVVVELQYVVPAGPDRTLFATPTPVKYLVSRIELDGVGNVTGESALNVARTYSVVSSFHEPAQNTPLADPGPEFTLLPTGLDRARIDGIVDSLTADLVDPVARTRVLLDWLRRSHIRYEEDERVVGAEGVKQVAPSRFDVDGFLADRKWGREVDFASAAAVLLRAAGIPCRLATGYAGSAWFDEAGFFVFRTPDAAAWVEIPFEGCGWVPWEAAPGAIDELPPDEVDDIFELPEEERAEEAAQALEEAEKPNLFRRIVDAIDKFVSRLVPGGSSSTTVGRLFAYLIVIVGLVLLFWGLLRVSRQAAHLVGRRGRRDGGGGRLFPFYERLVRALATLGYRRRPTETPLEFARAVVQAEGPALDDVEGLTRVFCALRYGEQPSTQELASQLTSRVSVVERLVTDRRAEPARPAAYASVLLVAVALVGTAFAQSAPDTSAVIEKLGSPAPGERRAAREALVGRGEEVVPELLGIFDDPESDRLDAEIARLIANLDHDDFRVREQATRELTAIGPAAAKALEAVLRRGSAEARHRARGILAGVEKPSAAEIESRRRATEVRRALALRVLAVVASGSDLEPIVLIGVARPELRDDVVRSLAAIGERHPADLMRLLERPRPEIGRLVVRALLHWPEERRRPPLLRLLDDPDPEVRRIARSGLVTMKVVSLTDQARLALSAGRPDDANRHTRAALALCPGYGEAGRILVDLLSRRGRHGEALALLGTLELPPVDAHMLRGRVLYRKKDLRGAIEALEAAYRAKPGYARPLIVAARLHLEAGAEGALLAVPFLDRAIAASRFDAEAWALRGIVRATWLGKPELARDDLRRALALDPGMDEARAVLDRIEGEGR